MPEQPVKDWEWATTQSPDAQSRPAHTMMIGGVTCMWWGDDPPPGVQTLKNAKQALEWADRITRSVAKIFPQKPLN